MSLCVSIWRGVSRWLRAARGCARWSRTAAHVSGCRTALTVLSCKQSGINISLRDRWGMPRRSRGVWRSFSNRATWVRILPWPIRIAAVARAAAQQQQHQQHAARSTQLSAKQLRVCARGAASLGSGSKQHPCEKVLELAQLLRPARVKFVILVSTCSCRSGARKREGSTRQARDCAHWWRQRSALRCSRRRGARSMGRRAREGRGRLAAGSYLHRFCLDRNFLVLRS